ncbi:MAG: biopolymer transporter ExbD [Acidobacteriota bacterium]|nr:biopolymer transporter ExbD [Acidobacteriota bacterium]
MQFRERTPPNVSIEMSPLIDVVFLLLIFFAATTTFLQGSSLELDLPESSTADEALRSGGERLQVIELGADGSIRLNERPVTIDSLLEHLRLALDEREDTRVVLRADRQARHGRVVAVLDVVRKSGARGLSVATLQKDSPGSAEGAEAP